MADKTRIIVNHISALWMQTHGGQQLRQDNPVHAVILGQYIERLSDVPEHELPVLIDSFSTEERMPKAEDIRAKWSRVMAECDAVKPKPANWSDVKRAAASPYAKGVVALLHRRFGVPVNDRHGSPVGKRDHDQPLTAEQFDVELRSLSERHGVR